jgi:hypothetical protein
VDIFSLGWVSIRISRLFFSCNRPYGPWHVDLLQIAEFLQFSEKLAVFVLDNGELVCCRFGMAIELFANPESDKHQLHLALLLRTTG